MVPLASVKEKGVAALPVSKWITIDDFNKVKPLKSIIWLMSSADLVIWLLFVFCDTIFSDIKCCWLNEAKFRGRKNEIRSRNNLGNIWHSSPAPQTLSMLIQRWRRTWRRQYEWYHKGKIDRIRYFHFHFILFSFISAPELLFMKTKWIIKQLIKTDHF